VLVSAATGLGQGGPLRPGATRAIDVRPRPFDPPRGAPSVVAHAGAAFDAAAPLDLVVFFHGWHGCAHAIVASGMVPCGRGQPSAEGLAVGAAVDGSARPVLLLVPQLAWRARNGSAGRFRGDGLAARWLEATLTALQLRGHPLARLTIAAHSAGFESANVVLRRGDLPERPTDVVLLDALYARTYDFALFATGGVDHRLVVVHGDSTSGQTRRLRRWAHQHLDDGDWLDDHASATTPWAGRQIVFVRSRAPHREIPARELAGVLRRLR
jgi:hypothetical protein